MPRDPVDVAELERDYEETYGTSEEQFKAWWEHQEHLADMEHSDGTK